MPRALHRAPDARSRGAARPCRALACASLVCALALAPSALSAQERPAEALVAVVGGRTPSAATDVVLLSDVELVAALALARGGAADTPPADALLEAALDQIVGEVLIRREASRLGAVAPTPDDIAEQRALIERSVGGAAALEALLGRVRAEPGEIDVLAERRAIVERFLSANLEGAADVTEADVQEAHAGARHPFAGRPLEEVREALRAWLRITRLDVYVARWLATLRVRTEVNVLRPFVTRRVGPVEETSDVGTR